MTPDDGDWHMDKKVPIGLMVGLALNAVLGIWYASKLDSRVSSLEIDSARTGVAIEKINDSNNTAATRLTKVEDHSESILEIVRRLDKEHYHDPFPRDSNRSTP